MNKPISTLKTIRRYCWIRCANKSSKLVRECKDKECPNFIYRMGKNSARTGIGVGIRGKNGQYQRQVTGLAGSSEMISSPVGQSTFLGDSQFKSPPSEEIALTGKGDFRIEKAGKEYIIRLRQEV